MSNCSIRKQISSFKQSTLDIYHSSEQRAHMQKRNMRSGEYVNVSNNAKETRLQSFMKYSWKNIEEYLMYLISLEERQETVTDMLTQVHQMQTHIYNHKICPDQRTEDKTSLNDGEGFV